MTRRGWALRLFLAALVVVWGGAGLSGWLFPEKKGERTYVWSARDAAEVRQVVVELPLNSWQGADLAWSATEAPQLETDEPAYGEPGLSLVREGDTLYVRPHPQAYRPNDERAAMRARGGLKLRLPMQVTRVTAQSLTVEKGSVPVELVLTGTRIDLDSKHLTNDITQVQIHAVGGPACGGDRPRVSVQGQRVHALSIETLDGSLKLSKLGPLPVVTLRGPATLGLELDQIGDLGKLQWAALSAEREAALRADAVRLYAALGEVAEDRSRSRQTPEGDCDR